jgi:MFS transporter, DHA2 family, multidrug resistance protein
MHSNGVQTEKWTRWMIAIAVMVSAVMELVDTSAVNVSLPYMAGNLSASVDEACPTLLCISAFSATAHS